MADTLPIEQFTSMYRRHYPAVLAYAASQVGRQSAEEVVSDTFMVAWRRLDDIPIPPLPWLLGVTRNHVRQLRRTADRHRTAVMRDGTQAWWERAVADVADVVADRATVIRAAVTLSDHDREVLTLIAWHGLDATKAAKVLGCSAPTFMVRLHRARRRLEKAMDTESRQQSDCPIRTLPTALCR